MDSPKPPNKAANLLNDLESIRALLDGNTDEPPLLTESIDPNSIPLLSEVVEHRLAQRPPTATQQPAPSAPVPPTRPAAPSIPPAPPSPAAAPAYPPEPAKISRELRAAAQLILQEVIDDFVPQIEAELQRRLEARLQRLLQPPRKP